jgi:hypothetical protein
MGIVEAALEVLSLMAFIMGALVLAGLLISAILIVVILILLAYSFKTGNVLFPNLLVTGIVFFESPLRAILRMLGVDDSRVDRICIQLKNKAICPTFRKIPYRRRAIFLPQCLRSTNCPAVLSPEGIKCKGCGACGISEAKKKAEKLGYMFFVVPGSSFIVRMMRKYEPQAIIGVGCLCEVREGLDMMHKYRIPAMGVILDRSGCVSTSVNWDTLFTIMGLGDTPPVDDQQKD